MNSIKKPKPAKLWKNSASNESKQKLPKIVGKEESSSEVPKKKKKSRGLKRKNQNEDFFPNKKQKPVTAVSKKSKNEDATNEIPNKKHKPVATDGKKNKNDDTHIKAEKTTNTEKEVQKDIPKKTKPEGMTRKDWKMLRLDKKSKKSKKEKTPQEPMTKGGWKKLHMKQKGKMEVYEVGQTLKKLWEELRREDCKPERKIQLLKQVCDHLKGRAKEFSMAHDTVRVLESVFALGAETHKTLLFEELKGEFLPLAKSKYGKFFLMKMLKYGNKQQKDTIMKAFHGHIISLIKHAESAEVLELAFNECANSTQRFEFIQEFFGATYKFFKVSDVHSLDELISANPEKKSSIIQNMKEQLMKVLDKSVVRHSIVHHVLWQFMKHSDDSSKSDIIESLRDVVPEILHTKDGSRVGMHCLWYGTNKDRKSIIKSMKRFVSKIAMEEHGHMVLLSLFDVVDDVVLVEKHIIQEIVKNLFELSQNVHGKKVLIYLLSPRDTHFFHPDIINILKKGDDNKTSKKDPGVRQSELKAIIADPLLNLVKSNIQEQYTNNSFCLFACTILQHTVGNKSEALESIADLLVEPYTTDNKNTHPVEHPGSSFMFKQLIIRDKNATEEECTFGEVLINKVPTFVMSSWLECNRGAFLLVSLIETNIPNVVARVKKELEGKKKLISKKNFKGAEILLKKLKEM